MSNGDRLEDSLKLLWEKATDVAAQGDFPKLLSVWESLVDKGVWQLSAKIAEIYERGAEGVDRNFATAITWYRRGIFEGDDPVAHIGLGRAYLKGLGLEQNIAAALRHFEKAHASGLPEANIYLGLMYYLGTGVQQDLNRARQHLEAAANEDFFVAYAFLARLAFEGGALLRALNLTIKSWRLAVQTTDKDPMDPRLLGADRIGDSKIGLIRTISTIVYGGKPPFS